MTRRPPGTSSRRLFPWALVSVPFMLFALLASGAARGQTPSPKPPPPTPVIQPGGQASLSPFPSTLRTPSTSTEVPEIHAASAVLADLDTGQVLFDLNRNERRPIASVTKIMTALLVVERTDLTDVVTVSEDAASGQVSGISGLGLVAGERIRVDELLYALLLQSANDAAEALAEHVSGSVDAFVDDMNARAEELGMTRTMFTSPNGLDDTGYSSAADLVRLTRAAYRSRGFPSVVATRFHTVESLDAEPRIVQNRNVLLWLYPGAIGVKTGYTSQAGFCVVGAAQRGDERLVAVVLGAPGEPFSAAATLLNYGFDAFERRTLLREGEGLDDVDVGGRSVSVSAGGDVRGLIPVAATVSRTVELESHVAFPPARGERIGIVRISAGGRVVGEVPLLVAGVPAPPPPEPGSWWGRAAGAIVEAGGGILDALFG
ncbi:MAG TPA: D-alanyl-D-alanine carboxypeptidase family protein [Actinomycetota bacterium]|nr:D-alanyl-D-alanine carboxypeptidase family protein [Actinomycetota bacterium]